MRCEYRSLFVLTALVATPLISDAQGGRWLVGGGLLVPSGDYSTHDKSGWHVVAGFLPMSSSPRPVTLRIDAMYGQTAKKSLAVPGTSRVFGVSASAELHASAVHWTGPYVLAGIGYYELEEASSGGINGTPVHGFGFDAGAGVSGRLGGMRGFLEARFAGAPGTNGVNFFVITVGVSFGS